MTAGTKPIGPRPADSNSKRVLWIDVARGIGIILVVYGHALRGIYWPIMPPTVALQDNIIYAFHMPVFFVVAGIFLWPSIRRGRIRFLKSKLKTVLYPYLLWSLIAGTIELLAARYVNTPITLREMILIPVAPIEQFWFLHALFLLQFLVMMLYPHKLLTLLLAVALPIAIQFVDVPPALVALLWLPYLAGGIAAAGTFARLADSRAGTKIVALLVSWAAFASLVIGQTELGLDGLLPKYLAGFAGTLGTVAISMLLMNVRAARWLVRLGQASMAIYVMHTIVSAGTRILISMMDLPFEPALVVVLSTLTGILVPYFGYVLAQRYGVALWLGIGGFARHENSAQFDQANPCRGPRLSPALEPEFKDRS